MSQTCSDQELRQWFDPLQLSLSDTEKKLRVGFPHPFFAQWFESHVQERFEEQLTFFFEPGFVLQYLAPPSASQGGFLLVSDQGAGAAGVEKQLDCPFGRSFTFETYFSNKKNNFPLALAKEVARNTGNQYNPFVICGASGTGKTHLLKAMANAVCKRQDKGDIFFGNVGDVVRIYAQQFKGNAVQARSYFQSFAHFFIDELQLLREHSDFQDELVLLFNAFHDNKKQMVFCCSDKIAACSFLNQKLRSRLEWGLIVNLMEPDLDIRISYIKEQCRKKSISLTKDQVLTLAQRFQDFRNLQGIMHKIAAFKEIMRKEIRAEEFENILNHAQGEPSAMPDPNVVLDVVAEHFDIPRVELLGEKRRHDIVQARQVAMYLCRDIIGCSYPALGRIFGGKDHSTAMYAVKKITKIIDRNMEMKQVVATLKKTCSFRDKK
ncbi:MAG: DnaA/Hda family protein [Desulfovibrionaceae bacterium]